MWEKIKKINLFPVLEFLIFIGSILFFGVTFKMLWEWYIVKAFKVPALSYQLAFGLTLIYDFLVSPIIVSQITGTGVLMFRFKGDVSREDQKKMVWNSIWFWIKFNILFPLKCLVVGYFFHLFV